jgi:hypothetical protein
MWLVRTGRKKIAADAKGTKNRLERNFVGCKYCFHILHNVDLELRLNISKRALNKELLEAP